MNSQSTVYREPSECDQFVESDAPDSAYKRVLMICCAFPPVGGAGVQRPVKFVKYLQQFGWKPTVLTAAVPSAPVFDNSLLNDIPNNVHIERTRTWEPSYKFKQNVSEGSNRDTSGIVSKLKSTMKRMTRRAVMTALQPDPQVLWTIPAYKDAKRFLKTHPHDAIFATAPPYSSFLLGTKLKQEFDIPLVVDYRDEWDLSSKYFENRQANWISKTVQESQQQRVLRAADGVIATTEASAQRLQQRLNAIESDLKAVCIYNGFDPTDFTSLNCDTEQPNDKYRIVYTGTLWNLTDITPLVEALERIHNNNPQISSRIELVVVGRKTPGQSNIVQQLHKTNCSVTIKDYSPHEQVLKMMSEGDALCLLLSQVPGAERVIPGKLFEYLAMNRRILGILPNGEAHSLVSQFFPADVFRPDEVSEIAEWIEFQVQNHGTIEEHVEHSKKKLAPFIRQNQTEQLSALLNTVCTNFANSK